MKRRYPYIVLLTLLSLSNLYAQQKNFTIEDLWKNFTFYPRGIQDIRSMNDGIHFTVLEDNCIIRHAYATGNIVDTVLDGDGLIDENGEGIRIMEYEFSSDESKVLLGTSLRPIYRHSTSGFFYIYHRLTGKLDPLSIAELGRQRLAEFSPNGEKVAFVRDNNIYIKDIFTGKEIQVTNDGKKNSIINGTCDWVYEEEFSFTKGFYWSPSGRFISFYRFDEREVREFTLTYYGALYPHEAKYKYPKAGEDNSLVTIHVYDLETAQLRGMDLGDEIDQYIPRIKWTSEDTLLSVFRLNRLQNHLEVLFADPITGKSRLFYEEKNEYYIDITDDFHFLKDRMIFTSEQSGYNHIHSIMFKSNKLTQVTQGAFDITEIKGVDPSKQLIYYRAAKSSPINTELFSIKFDGKKELQLSRQPGMNDATFSNTYEYYISHWSDANTPDYYSIVDKKGTSIVLETNADLVENMSEYAVPRVEFSTLKTPEGVELHYWMMKPVDFSPEKRYPLLMYVYGGPGSQTVTNEWSYQQLWFQHLTQLGYIVVSVDNRGTGHRGEEFKKCTYLQLGKYETEDQISAAKYFGKQSFVDESRIGIWGWSYGGYMSTLCMTKGADVFKTGVAVAPVTNWRYYDNIYTERFMRTPQENGDHYDVNSPTSHVGLLKGNYLLVHGLTDDNVHVQNAYDLVNALVGADKQFSMFLYPNRNHGIYGGNTRNQLYRLMTDFLIKNL